MRIRFLLISTLWISGCSMIGDKDTILPQNGPTMQEVYHGHFAGGGSHATRQHTTVDGESAKQPPIIRFGQRPIHTGSIDLEAYTRSAANDIEQRFVRLPNPTLVLYVFPHLGADNRYPVPGYSTAFPLYEQVYYALPGEAERQP